MKISTTVVFRHTIIAPKGRAFHEKFLKEYKKVLGEGVEIRMAGDALRLTEQYINTFDDDDIDWAEFMDEHLAPLTIKRS